MSKQHFYQKTGTVRTWRKDTTCVKTRTAIFKGKLSKVLKEEIQKTTDRQRAPTHTPWLHVSCEQRMDVSHGGSFAGDYWILVGPKL